MPIKRYTTEQIIGILREAEILNANGDTVVTASRKLGISEQSYYRWRKEYGGMKVSHAKRLKKLLAEAGKIPAADPHPLAYTASGLGDGRHRISPGPELSKAWLHSGRLFLSAHELLDR